MLKTIAATLVSTVALVAPALAQEIKLFSPKHGALVENRQAVKGTVDFAPLDEKVWLLIKPMGMNDIWVQPFANVDSAGHFEVRPFFGRAMDIDNGTEYELRAVADPSEKLREGMRLSDWPQGRARTEIIRVTRR